MAGRFPLFTDNHIRQPLVEGLLRQGWDVVRSVDVFKEGEDDAVLFAWAAKQGRVLLTNDKGLHRIAKQWLQAGRTDFRMVFWKQLHHQRMSEGDFLVRLERMAQEAEPFRYPIRYIRPD